MGNIGWGGAWYNASAVVLQSTGGNLSPTEQLEHINYLELLASFLRLKSFASQLRDIHIHIQTDNTTTVACLQNMGNMKSALHKLTKQVWMWCMTRNIWISASRLPGHLNLLADHESRNFNLDTEWSLDPKVFKQISKRFGDMDIDLFASRLNKKLANYVSWRPDPAAIAFDAFTINWSSYYAYVLAPFSVVGAVLQKLQRD